MNQNNGIVMCGQVCEEASVANDNHSSNSVILLNIDNGDDVLRGLGTQ